VTGRQADPDVTSPEAREFYQRYSVAEERERTNQHYDQPADFFLRILGGRWHVYSCNLWDASTTETESQERKLDLLASLMGLEPGRRILDVGCGWGGPLVYLSKTYGVQGVGLTLSPSQQATAEARIARHGADAQVFESNWRDFNDDAGFDVVYTDEAIVHFEDLRGYFQKVNSLLRPDGLMLNKELHFAHPRYSRDLNRSSAFVNEIFGATGNYRTLGEELLLLEETGFELRAVQQLSLEHYRRTFDHWIANLRRHKVELMAVVGQEYYRRFHAYMAICRRYIVNRDDNGLHVVVAGKM
jgi:cyclopropane-fatty-acyl-phospholipid synthase